MLPVVLKMANDAVPNIRFNVAKTLKVRTHWSHPRHTPCEATCFQSPSVLLMSCAAQALLPYVEQSVAQQKIRPVVLHLVNEDNDRDVKFFAQQALAEIS